MKCSGLHCSGCASHAPRAGVIAALVVLALVIAKARAIGRTAAEVAHVLVIAAVAATGLAVAAGTTAAVVILHRRAARQEALALPVPLTRAEIPASVQVIGPGRRGLAPELAPASVCDSLSVCGRCGRPIARSPASGLWWAVDGLPAGSVPGCAHEPARPDARATLPRASRGR